MTFGEKLRILRKRNNYTQSELADFLGVTLRAVGFYEADKRFPKPEILNKIVDVLNVEIEFLIDDTKQIVLTNEELFIDKAVKEPGRKVKTEAIKIITSTKQLKAGGDMSLDDWDAFFECMSEIYSEAKNEAKKYAPKNKNKT